MPLLRQLLHRRAVSQQWRAPEVVAFHEAEIDTCNALVRLMPRHNKSHPGGGSS
jgi:hypothetical protein